MPDILRRWWSRVQLYPHISTPGCNPQTICMCKLWVQMVYVNIGGIFFIIDRDLLRDVPVEIYGGQGAMVILKTKSLPSNINKIKTLPSSTIKQIISPLKGHNFVSPVIWSHILHRPRSRPIFRYISLVDTKKSARQDPNNFRFNPI